MGKEDLIEKTSPAPPVSFIRFRFVGSEEKEAAKELETRERIRISCIAD